MPDIYDAVGGSIPGKKKKREEPVAAEGPVKRIKYAVDTSTQQDAIAKYRQLKVPTISPPPNSRPNRSLS